MFKKLFFAVVTLASLNAFAAEQSDLVIHNELRGLLQGLENAVNEERYHELSAFFHENLRVTTINQEIISSRNEIGEYFDRWFGPDGYLKKVDMKLNADTETELYADNTFGIIRGSGIENYILSDSRYYEMLTRWTATVIKDSDGQWRILSLHIGTNFLDNPILAEAESSLIYSAAGGLAVGIILILLLSLVWRFVKK